MTFKDIFSSNKKVLSLEFFPPKKESQLEETFSLIGGLAELCPDFMTVTYGAGGGTRDRTRQIVCHIHRNLKVPAVAHLTCVGHSVEELDGILNELSEAGVGYVLALRGDPPKDQSEFTPHPEGFTCARDLAAHIKANHNLSIGVAGYPEVHQDAVSPDADMDYLKEKVDAGAEVIFTQLFFESEIYFRFLDKAQSAGIDIPIQPGVMPIANVSQVKRFTNMCGASIPTKLSEKLEELENSSQSVVDFGTDYATALCEELIKGGAPGVHLYTLNKSQQVKPIVESLSSLFQSK